VAVLVSIQANSLEEATVEMAMAMEDLEAAVSNTDVVATLQGWWLVQQGRALPASLLAQALVSWVNVTTAGAPALKVVTAGQPEFSRDTIRLLRRAERFHGQHSDRGRSGRVKAGKAEMYTFLAGKALAAQGVTPVAYEGLYAMYLDAFNNDNLRHKYNDGDDLMSQFMSGALPTGRSKKRKVGQHSGPGGDRPPRNSRPGYQSDSSASTSSSDSDWRGLRPFWV
jgi:hypothetical protein